MDIYHNMYDQEAEFNKILTSSYADGNAEGKAENKLIIETLTNLLNECGINSQEIIEVLQEI